MIDHSRKWEHFEDPQLGLMFTLSRNIKKLEERNPHLLPDIRRGSIIFVASDYSGQHDGAEYQVLSFLLTDLEHCLSWEKQRNRFRQAFLADGRRMSFKNLGDKQRGMALLPFLNAANKIPGLSATIVIHKEVDSLFLKSGRLKMTHPNLEKYHHWGSYTFEKLLRVVHFVSFFVAGLSRPGQDVLWFTDQDDIAANPKRLTELTEICANVMSHYLTHNLRHFRCGTTGSDDGSRQIEDLVSIPDIVAGALSELLTTLSTKELLPNGNLITPLPKTFSPKTTFIMQWFSDSFQPLKRLVCLISPIGGSSSLNCKWLRFHDLTDLNQVLLPY